MDHSHIPAGDGSDRCLMDLSSRSRTGPNPRHLAPDDGSLAQRGGGASLRFAVQRSVRFQGTDSATLSPMPPIFPTMPRPVVNFNGLIRDRRISRTGLSEVGSMIESLAEEERAEGALLVETG